MFKAETIMKYCEVWHKSSNKLFDNDSIEVERTEMKVYCVQFIYYALSGITSLVDSES